MANTDGKWVINKGDRVTIAACGITKTGTVIYVNCWDGKWDIEMINEYAHWKQYFDGGKIVNVERRS